MSDYTTKKNNSDGSIIVSILVVTLFLSTFIFSLIVLANSSLVRARGRVLLLQSQYAAESGADAAIAQLNNNNTSYVGSGGEVVILQNAQYKSTFEVTVVDGSNSKEKIITATGRVYAPANSLASSFSRKIEITAQRSTASTSSSIISRNIIDIQSGVKNIRARDVYLNGYINMNKNTTTLIAENITVADKNTGASNCSIGGTGNLVKPTTFADPSQTKTRILIAYNNCISPPGNLSNANFDVTPNLTSISKIQSTLVPWSEFMDTTYQNSAGGCNDWTTGSSPRSIPSTGNTKKTHYPDMGSNISTLCGTSGDLSLGTNRYDILDHTHVRASFCAASACKPTFFNPDTGAAGLKFVFVEGTINFDSVQTVTGSGPIVFVSYGADPASKSSVCPLGGAVYLGNSGDTIAPAIFFLANNGLCLDKTRFGADPALGGISGKNLYIATNPGTPFDLGLDPNFPVSQIPIDLAWRAVLYRRL
ncbi:hypothetical protein H0X10_02530 [Candidatus Saccharibacteria bacterium]|nr:hypothetical protein [Candidatus Saccharibacteria bacterium]